jgi:hypothetical protein
MVFLPNISKWSPWLYKPCTTREWQGYSQGYTPDDLYEASRNAVVVVRAHIDEGGSLGVAYLWGIVIEHPDFLCILSTSKMHPMWKLKKKKNKKKLTNRDNSVTNHLHHAQAQPC